jgi:hypothetical protein
MRRIAGIVVLGLVLVALRGCVNPFAPKLTQSLEGEEFIVTEQKNPEEVLQNFKVAYTFQDSLLYSNLLDTAFIFVYFDPNEGTSGSFVSWGRETDLVATGRLFRHFQVIDLVWNTTYSGWEDDDQGEVRKGFDLSLVGTESDYRVSGKAVFSFRKCRDEKWRITRWKDESDL